MRRNGFVGVYSICIASSGDPDCGLTLHFGDKGENYIEISIYDKDDKVFKTVKIHLSHASMLKIKEGFDKADRISRRKMTQEKDLDEFAQKLASDQIETPDDIAELIAKNFKDLI